MIEEALVGRLVVRRVDFSLCKLLLALYVPCAIDEYKRGLAPLPLGTRRPRGRRGPALVGVLILVIVVRGVCGPALLCWRIVVPVLISAP